MSSTTSKGIVYPTSGDQIAPLETVFANLANSVDTNMAPIASPTFTGTVTAPTLTSTTATVSGTLTAGKVVGDVYSSNGTSKILEAGTDGTDATFTGTASVATKATKIAGGAAMSLPYQSALDTTAFLAAGTAGKVLQTNGTGAAPTWVTPAALIYASATARNTALPSPVDGTITYLQDTNEIQIYNGSAWSSMTISSASYPNQLAVKSDSDSITRPLPFSILSAVTPSITGSGSVTFPNNTTPSRFSQTPIIVATAISGTSNRTSCTVNPSGTTGFSIYFWTGSTASSVAATAGYTAIQMTSASAAG